MTMAYQLMPEHRHFPHHNQHDFYHSGAVSTSCQWQQFVKSSSNLAAAEDSALCWNAQELSVASSGWPGPLDTQSSFRASNPGYHNTSNSGFSTPSDYPESSQRTVLPPTPTTSQTILPSNSYEIHLPHSPALAPEYGARDGSWGDSSLYGIDEPEMMSFPHLPSNSPPPVKEEPDDDDCFIMELAAPPSTHLSQALAPPTEVPLRATQASKEMRKMMGVFRLNPFAMHSGAGRGAVPSSWYGGEAGPLEKEPLVFEFQLDLDDGLLESPAGTDGLRSFSPDFEVESKDEGERAQWTAVGRGTETTFQPLLESSPSWDLAYSPTADYVSPPESAPSSDFPARRSVRLHSVSSHPYSRRNLHHDNFLSSITTSSVEMNRMRPPSEPSWSKEYIDNSRVTGFVGNSAECGVHIEGLPSFSAMGRRWSVPGANPQAPFLM